MKEPDTSEKRLSAVVGNVRKMTLTGKVTVKSAGGKSFGVEGKSQESVSVAKALGSLSAVAVAFGLTESLVQHVSISVQTGYPLFLATYSYLDVVPLLPSSLASILLIGVSFLLIQNIEKDIFKIKGHSVLIVLGCVIGAFPLLGTLIFPGFMPGILIITIIIVIILIINQIKPIKSTSRILQHERTQFLIRGFVRGFVPSALLFASAIVWVWVTSLRDGVGWTLLLIICIIAFSIAVAVIVCNAFKNNSFIKIKKEIKDINLITFVAILILMLSAALVGAFMSSESQSVTKGLYFVLDKSSSGVEEESSVEMARGFTEESKEKRYKILDTFSNGKAIIEFTGDSGSGYRLVSLENGYVVRSSEPGSD